MQNIYCFKHPVYRGIESPVLSCKTCCAIFVAKIKSDVKNMKPAEEASEAKESFDRWYADKKAQAVSAVKSATQPVR